jgi:hypothetical protein
MPSETRRCKGAGLQRVKPHPRYDRGCCVHERERWAVQERSERPGSTTKGNHSDFTGPTQAEMGTHEVSALPFSHRDVRNRIADTQREFPRWMQLGKHPRMLTIRIVQSGLSYVIDTMNFSDEAALIMCFRARGVTHENIMKALAGLVHVEDTVCGRRARHGTAARFAGVGGR